MDVLERDPKISEVIEQDWNRLRKFIRSRVPDRWDAEDILQDVFFELVEAYRLMKPIEQVSGWLFRVARNRIIDLVRKKRPEAGTTNDELSWEDLLPSREAGPDAVYVRRLLLEELDEALNELPEEQRFVFIAHELDGKSYKELAAATGLSVNTLTSRKHYAVLHLRRRLRGIYEELKEG